jgi:hypothetical protein
MCFAFVATGNENVKLIDVTAAYLEILHVV